MKTIRILGGFAVALLLGGCMMPQLSVPDAQPMETTVAGHPSVRMLVWEGYLALEVGDLQTASKAVEAAAKEQGGTVESRMAGRSRTASFRIRVPVPALQTTMDRIKALGHVVTERVSADDVTAQCIDLQARLQNEITLRDRLKKLLDKAENVRDVLSIEKELARVQTEVDSLDGRLKSLKDKVGMATLTVEMTRQKVLGPLGYVFKGLGWAVKKLFVLRD